MQSPTPIQSSSVSGYGVLILLLAIAGTLLIASFSIEYAKSDVSTYYVDKGDANSDIEGDSDPALTSDVSSNAALTGKFCHIQDAATRHRAHLATLPPSRAPPA